MTDAWQRSFWFWELLFAVAYAATALLVLFDDLATGPKVVAEVALAALALSYPVAGRHVVKRADNSPANWAYVAVLVVCLGTAVFADTTASFALFIVCPLLFMLLDVRWASAVTALVILMEPVSAVTRGGWDNPSLPILLPMTAILVVFSVLAGKFTTDVIQESTERGELIRRLEDSQAEVSRLSREAGTAAERERLAREIHDTLAQGFTSIVTLTQAIESELDTDPDAVRRHLALAGRTARENLAEARAMVAALTPSELAAGSLAEAVRRQAARLADETALTVECEVDSPLPALGTAAEVVLLRATQEALTNVRKHAAATTVLVRLSAADSGVRLLVRDDGAGFSPAGPTEGFGLRGMRSRVEQVGGRLAVRSARGDGTELELEVPA
ncbi:sensor histidine kinase [Amycolatopsis sp. PS_44_ISF1]|uniref:sensor histidine kinase n=1 Tax=Amycolatopsis sp. PS_44_ISF1 TaxID=2974917 RepID=UPI0028DE44B8|nr:sensor histidine kinase [Amycolatopsis sp. PS_44_ISF1]MDT8911180.1 sensor histidine kinase [Amycolatopsis sp. PS_44_ISF1]